MAYVIPHVNINCSFLYQKCAISYLGISVFPFLQPRLKASTSFSRGTVIPQCFNGRRSFTLPENRLRKVFKKDRFSIPRSTTSNSSGDSADETKKTPFGYTRKDVILIGVGVTLLGIGLKSGLEFAGVDPLQAGNVVQLVLVLGLTIGWISTYIFRVSNKEMTYAQQLRDYEGKVMEKRLESLTEAELQALLEEVEEEKRR
ncbi:hypothetical protein Lalb_Chr05g0221591 [Lupinus albus]|uniref:Transmembrane protein n=1 Tax=Lupinus albus TaxID=3870 RepID=A0A6A4QJC6_LUPAL|nr:hypothetical protein Lalb_Chr05g0221591 [Lupinus albus]